MMERIVQFYRQAMAAWTRFDDHDGWAISSYMAMSTLLAIFPFLIFVASLVSVLSTPGLQEEVVRLLFDTWPHVVAEPIAVEVNKVLGSARPGLMTLSAILAVYLASNAVEAIRIGLNRAYGLREKRPFWWTRLQSLFFVLTAAISLITLAVLVVLWPVLWDQAVRFAPAVEQLAPVISAVRFTLTFVIVGGAVVLSHYFLPASRRKFSEVLPGATLTLGLWILAGTTFGSYLESFSNYSRTYAGLGGVAAALFFLWLISVAFLAGAEVNAALIRRKRRAVAAKARSAEIPDAV